MFLLSPVDRRDRERELVDSVYQAESVNQIAERRLKPLNLNDLRENTLTLAAQRQELSSE